MTKRRTSADAARRLVAESLAIEAEAAREAGELGYLHRAMALAGMPHRRYPGTEFTRRNGQYTLTMLAPSELGLPYGSVPRLVLAWLSTEAVRTRERELELGRTLSGFMGQLDLVPTGGRWGTIPRLRNQMARLFACAVHATHAGDDTLTGTMFSVAEDYELWWSPQRPAQAGLWQSRVRLSDRFYRELVEHPVPVDVRALKALRRSPMALDIYCWATHRMSYLRRRTVIPWPALRAQFGADYGRERDFRGAFLKHLKAVRVVYPEAKVDPVDEGLELRPSKPHVARLGRDG
jgi:hypothetical protein